MKKHILLIEDEAAIADTIVYALAREAYAVRCAGGASIPSAEWLRAELARLRAM